MNPTSWAVPRRTSIELRRREQRQIRRRIRDTLSARRGSLAAPVTGVSVPRASEDEPRVR